MATTFYSISEAAERLGLSRQRVWVYLKTRRLEGQRVGAGSWIIPAASLARLEAQLRAARGRRIASRGEAVRDR